jgi:hypothetical protein
MTAPLLFLAALLQGPEFHRDIAPILQKRCQTCHRPGEIAPMPLLSYKDVRPWAKAIRQAVLLKKMPPWFAESSSAPLVDDPRLSAEEMALIDRWTRSGSPEGNPRHAPPAVRWSEGWNIPAPDRIAAGPEALAVPARGELDYQFLILPLGLMEDRWVSAAEIRPGERRVVHHVVAYIRERDSEWLRDAPVGKHFARPGVTTSDILAVYAPGQPAMILPSGLAKKIPAGADLVLQIHYTPDGKPARDRTVIGLKWAASAPEKRVLTLQLASTDFRIPTGEPSHRVTVSGTLPNDCELLSFFPHMHLRGKAFEYSLESEGGHVETLLRVAPYDFYWQLRYQLARTRFLKKGFRLRATAWYDNSRNNPRNPDPTAEVSYGEQSREEMMVGFFDVIVPAAMDKTAFFAR